MSFGINTVILIGNLTRDAGLKNVGATSVLNFSIAVSDDYLKDGQKVEQSYFFDCVVWGKRAESLQRFLNKGSKIAVEGSLKQDRWQDQDGKNRSKCKINATNVVLLGGKPEANNQAPQQNYNQQQPVSNQPPQPNFNSNMNDGDCPF